MSILYLFRHGITEGNEKRLYYGMTDLPLSNDGKGAVRKRVECNLYPDPKGFDIITSSLLRTKETAELIYGKVPMVSYSEINEINFGEFEMKSYDDLKDDKKFNEWISGDNWKNICPGGESGEMMIERARPIIEKFKCGNHIVFCHGGIITSFIMEWFPNDNLHSNYYEWQPKPCEGYMVEFNEERKPINYKEIRMDQ